MSYKTWEHSLHYNKRKPGVQITVLLQQYKCMYSLNDLYCRHDCVFCPKFQDVAKKSLEENVSIIIEGNTRNNYMMVVSGFIQKNK